MKQYLRIVVLLTLTVCQNLLLMSEQSLESDPLSTDMASGFGEPRSSRKDPLSSWHREYLTKRTKSLKKEVPFTIKTQDGHTRRAILALCTSDPKGVVILCHPAAQDKNFMIPYDELVFPDYHTIRFDFRRHGELSSRQYTTLGEREVYEIFAIHDWTRRNEHTRNLPLFGFGISLGAAALIEAEARQHMFDGLILQASFESLGRQIKRMSGFYSTFPFLMHRQPTRFIAKKTYRWKVRKVYPERSIAQVRAPIFLIHAQNDRFIALEACEALAKAGKTVKEVWNPPTGKHTQILPTHLEEYPKRCNAFLLAILEQQQAKREARRDKEKVLHAQRADTQEAASILTQTPESISTPPLQSAL